MKRNKTIYVSRLLLLCMLTLLLTIVGCGNQSVETEDKNENSKSIEIINLLDENSYTVIRQIKCGLLPQIKNNFLRYAEALQSVLFATISAHCFM